jgi:hypothetical protein
VDAAAEDEDAWGAPVQPARAREIAAAAAVMISGIFFTFYSSLHEFRCDADSVYTITEKGLSEKDLSC